MPKVAKELSALEVKNLVHPGGKRNVLCSVGGVSGLHMQITPHGGRSWVLRIKVGEKRRDLGLGGFPSVTLSQAREKARDARAKIEAGIDPVEERKAANAALVASQRRGLTFADAVDKALAAKLDAFRNAKHRQQWENTLATYATPELGNMLVQGHRHPRRAARVAADLGGEDRNCDPRSWPYRGGPELGDGFRTSQG